MESRFNLGTFDLMILLALMRLGDAAYGVPISDQISKRQIGNGMFLVFVAGIVAGLSRTLGLVDPFAVLTYAALHVAVVGVVSHRYRRAIAPPQPG